MTLFENLELQHNEEGRELRHASVIATERVKTRFSAFLGRSDSGEEFDARLDLVKNGVKLAVDQACDDAGYYADREGLYNRIVANIKQSVISIEEIIKDEKKNHDDDDNGMDKEPSDPAMAMPVLTLAANTDTGDTYTQETVDLPKADQSGLDVDPTAKLDPSSAGDEWSNSLPKIEVPSVRNPVEEQNVRDRADYRAPLEDSGVIETVDPGAGIQPEFNVAPNTETFPNTDQANPVTAGMGGPGMVTDPGNEGMTPDEANTTPYNPGDIFNMIEELGKHYGPDKAREMVNKALDSYFDERQDNAMPREPQGLSGEDMSGMHMQGEEDPSVEEGRLAKWKMV